MCEDAGFEDISVCHNPDYKDLAPRIAANGTTPKPRGNDEYGGVEEEEEDEEEEEGGEDGEGEEEEEGGGGRRGDGGKGGGAPSMVWSGRVFALHDVYVNNKGQVFNSTHVFNPNGCYAEDKFHYEACTRVSSHDLLVNLLFHYEPGTRVSSHDSLVNLLVVGATPGARLPFHEILELVPLFLPLSRVLKKHGKPALVMRGKKLPRVVGITMGRMLSFGDASRLLFVRTLIQPTFQHCQQPSPSLWSKLRTSHFLQPWGLPLLNPDWSERLPPTAPKALSPPAALPPWETSGVKEVIVLEPPATVQVKGFAEIVAGLKGKFGAEHVRLVGRFQRDDAKELFPRAALLVSITSPFLVNLAFLPPRAALLELRPPPAEVDAVIADSVARLAAACQIHHRVIRGSFMEGAPTDGVGIWKGAEEGTGKGAVEWRSGAVEAAAMFLARVVGKALTADEKVVEEAALTAADQRMRAAQLAQASTSKKPLIPGTQIQSPQSAAQFRRWLRCVSQRGRWVYNATPRILPWEYLGTMNLCDHRHRDTTGGLVTKKADKYAVEGGAPGGWSVRESLKYEWRTPPGKCPIGPLRQLDGDMFCRKVEGRKGGLNVLFLGDSLAHQMVDSFLNGLLRHIPKPAVWAVNETIPKECSDWLVDPPRHAYCRVYTFNESFCPGLTVQFVRNDHLWFTSPGEAKFDHIPWHLYSGLKDADVVVVNRGAHFIGGKDFERSVPAALEFLRKKLPDALIIWRNTPPGHANCTSYTGPIKKRQNPEFLPFHWDFHHHSLAANTVNIVTGKSYLPPAPSAAPSPFPSATPMTAPSAAHLPPSDIPPAAPPIPSAPRTSPSASPISPSALLGALSSLQSKISALQVLVPLVAQSGPSEALQQQQEVAAVGVATVIQQVAAAAVGLLPPHLQEKLVVPDIAGAVYGREGVDGASEERRREGGGGHGGGGEMMAWGGGDVMHGAVKEEVQAMDDVSMGGGDDINGTPMPLRGTYYGAPDVAPDVTPDDAPDGAAYDGGAGGGAMACQAVAVPTASHVSAWVAQAAVRAAAVVWAAAFWAAVECATAFGAAAVFWAAAAAWVCGKGFKRDANLRMHMRGHGDAYKGATSLSRPALSAARSATHPAARSATHPAARPQRYSCPEPGCKRNQQHPEFQPLKTILCVKNHYRRTHCAKQYTCSRCGVKQFAVLADLRTHEKHCGRSSWKCSCGSSFSRKDKLLGHLSHFTGHHAVAAGPSDLPLPALPSPAASTPAAAVDAAIAAASAAVSGAAAGDTAGGSGGGDGSSSAAFAGYHEGNSGVAMGLAGGGGRVSVGASRSSSVVEATNMAAGGSPAAPSTVTAPSAITSDTMARYAVVAFALLALFAVCHARPAPLDDDITDNTVVPNLKGLSREKIQELALTDLAAWDEEDNGVSAAEADKIVVDEDNTVAATDDAADDSDNTVAASSEDVADSDNSVVASSAEAADEDNTVAVAEPADSDNTVAVVATEAEDDVVAVMPEDNVATASAAKSTDMGIAMVV
ncbi:unnamed protein product [Closterium sp. NIES-65]|nr:unnamed protein product [Closterium sp. NIES-65]